MSLGVDIGIVHETKCARRQFAVRKGRGYAICSTNAGSSRCGGVALIYREDKSRFVMKNLKVQGRNTISVEIQTGNVRYFTVGCYIPPSDRTEETYGKITGALDCQPKGTLPLILGDLNVDLEHPRSTQEARVAELIDNLQLRCLSRHFKQRRQKHIKGR